MSRTLIAQIIRGLVVVGLVIVLGGIMLRGYRFYHQLDTAKEKLADIQTHVMEMEDENNRLQSDINYYGNPDNLEKEARTRFNYKELGEEVWRIIPGQ